MNDKKQTFLHGAALLALATAVVKIIGAFYKIPLKIIIGDQGYGYFITAYDIYTVLLLISTAGLPIAMSRMISQASSLGHYNQVRRIYATARGIFLGLGAVSTALMMIFSHQLAAFQKQPDAWAAIFCLGPCALLMCVMSTYRGFFQGQGNMRPTSNSQILEAVFKLVVGLVLAYGVMKATNSIAYAAGAAILGVTVSCLVSALYLNRQQRPAYRELPVTDDVPKSYGATAKQLLVFAVPITIGSAGLQILTVIETNLYMGQLLTANGMSQSTADITKGIYNMCQTVFNMPCAFMVPITTSVLPAITAQLTTGNHTGAKATEESAARITGLISLPCAVGLSILAGPVMGLLGGYEGKNLALAGTILTVLGINIFFYGTIQYTNVVLQSHGYAHIPVINTLLCGGMKLVVVYLLVGNPQIGIVGAPVGMLLCYLCIGVMNLIAINRVVPQKAKILQNLLCPMAPAALMGGAVWGVYRILMAVPATAGSRVLLCGVPVAVGVAVYLAGVVVFKSIRREDCLLLPKGEKLAKFLHL
ncbi:MAG: polysaccharide biosynthesis protein [Oscillospiraceae bacterium]|nr:polysaccharide biosynthesis protein [Oscillospiraceae bacterium]